VSERDPFWAAKQAKKTLAPEKPHYKDIIMPKDTSASIFIAGFSLAFGFAMVWHIWWLAAIGLVGVVLSIIIRTLSDDTEYRVTAAEVARIEAEAAEQYA
jgi:cytochrome o ubiquinol oxidase subunit 1